MTPEIRVMANITKAGPAPARRKVSMVGTPAGQARATARARALHASRVSPAKRSVTSTHFMQWTSMNSPVSSACFRPVRAAHQPKL